MIPQKPPIVALVGRTNVGKSTLFNRLLETHKALVSHTEGTTRDRNEGDCLWRGKVIRVVDTGGLDIEIENDIERGVMKQVDIAIKQSDLLLFVVDVKTGVLPQEVLLAAKFRDSGKPVIVVGNKAEKISERLSFSELQWQFPGLPSPITVSAVRGTGIGDLLDEVYDRLEKIGKPPVEQIEINAVKVAVIGKPNVGKSTLLNSLINEERFITSPIAHTTREPNDTLLTMGDKQYVFIDTAGMRKRGKVKRTGGLEEAAVRRNESVVKTADVTLFIIDATEPIGTQEKALAGFLKESGSGVIVVVNKWDLVEDKKTNTINRYREYIAGSLPFISWAPVVFVSALTHQRVQTLFDEIDRVSDCRKKWLTEKELESFLKNATLRHAPVKGRGPWVPKILGIKQVAVSPPTFDLVIKAKRTDTLNISYIRFLENQLRTTFGFVGVPTHIDIRLATAVSD